MEGPLKVLEMNNQENQAVEIDVSLSLKATEHLGFQSFWSLLSLPLQHFDYITLLPEKNAKVLAGSTWSVVKTRRKQCLDKL